MREREDSLDVVLAQAPQQRPADGARRARHEQMCLVPHAGHASSARHAQFAPNPKLNSRSRSPARTRPPSQASFRLMKLSAAMTCPLRRDVVGKETIERQTQERQQNLPAAQRDVVRHDERDVAGAETQRRERFAHERPRGWKVGGHDLVAAAAGIPVIPLGDLPMRQDPIARRIALDQHRAGAIGDDVVDDLPPRVRRQDVRADAHDATRLRVGAKMIGRHAAAVIRPVHPVWLMPSAVARTNPASNSSERLDT